jgi:signal peptidase I
MSRNGQVEPRTKPRLNMSGARESVESFVVVFLGFLVLGLEAEGFVIPTGSMAPTLMGRHKEVACPECGFVYTVNADNEVGASAPSRPEARWVVAGTCVNCRYVARIDDLPNFQGDRIYVIKTPLTLPFFPALGAAEPARWDVAVFKVPEEPEVRYIKRRIGMPNEVVRIHRGDIWVGQRGKDAPFTRPRRPLAHQEAMQIAVHDDSHRAKSLEGDPRWRRWVSATEGGWKESADKSIVSRYEISADAPEWAELRFRNVVPDPVQWASIVRGEPLSHPPRPTLITDFYAYNTELTEDMGNHPSGARKSWNHPHWVGDLTLKFDLNATARKGVVRVELIKGGVANICEIDLERDEVSLHHGNQLLAGPVHAGLARTQKHAVSFANVDDRLTIQVDGSLPFGEGVTVAAEEVEYPNADDLSPVSITAKGASVAVERLRISRDIYYTLDPTRSDLSQLDREPFASDPVALFDWLGDPSRFEAFSERPPTDYPISPGHYMMLGDNSPYSKDGRAWSRKDQTDPNDPTSGWDRSGRESWEVPEALLIGKAFCVYWPHLMPVWPNVRFGRDTRLPAVPNFWEMRWIR